ncbi:MAG TPA: ABC transporter substrate-binding protein [Actinomycetota bacterium]|jgi:alpha-glucoside transport system substrate-binding protein
MRRHRGLAPVLLLALIAGACSSGGNDNGNNGGSGDNIGRVSVLNAMEPTENQALQAVVDKDINANADYVATLEANSDFETQVKIRVEGGNPPDVAFYPQPGSVIEQAKAGNAVALEDLGYTSSELEKTYGSYLMGLVEYQGKHYGIPTNVNLKSMIWYPKDDFDKAGYQVPKTWDQLLALSDQIKADGGTPWCVGFESGGATGWPATDWMEDIMLDTAGVQTYDKWVDHQIPFTDPSVKHAAELFGDIMFHPGWVLGGAAQTPSIAFGDAPLPMFKEPPGCWLHRQANFINAFFPSDAEAGKDYDFFPFPSIDQQNTLIGGEYGVVFRNAPEVADFVKKFAGTKVQCDQGGNVATSRISPNASVQASCYANPILGEASETVTKALQAGTARFDASDAMPSAVGSGTFWTGMVKYMQDGPSSLDGVLSDIDKSWPSS